VFDEPTSETYTMSFTGAQSRFNGRIRGHYQNYTWTSNSASFAPTANQDYTAVFSAPAISNINVPNPGGDGTRGTFYAAHAHDVDVEIRGKFHEDQEDDGFNHFATRYATNITKTVGVEDTYNGSAITCFLPDTPIELANGEIIPIEDLVVGDNIKSFHIENLPNPQLELFLHLPIRWVYRVKNK
jgi:hypothetical protein